MDERPDLAALASARICHDLIGPVGAIGNGVELMMLEAGNPSPELALVAESVAQASARIRFFRIAYGPAGHDLRIARSDVLAALNAPKAGGRLEIEWASADELSRVDARLALLLLQCLETAMPYGGRITIACGEGGLHLQGSGPRMRHDSPWWERLQKKVVPADAEPPEVHFALAIAALQARDHDLAVTLGDDTIRLEL